MNRQKFADDYKFKRPPFKFDPTQFSTVLVGEDDVSLFVAEVERYMRNHPDEQSHESLYRRVFRVIMDQMYGFDANRFTYTITQDEERITFHMKYYRRQCSHEVHKVVKMKEEWVRKYFGGRTESSGYLPQLAMRGKVVGMEEAYKDYQPSPIILWNNPREGLRRVSTYSWKLIEYE